MSAPRDTQSAPDAASAPRSAFWRLWGWPLGLGVLTAVGLVCALFSDGGLGDWLAWLTLGIPSLACVWFGWMRRTPPA